MPPTYIIDWVETDSIKLEEDTYLCLIEIIEFGKAINSQYEDNTGFIFTMSYEKDDDGGMFHALNGAFSIPASDVKWVAPIADVVITERQA